MTRADVSVPLGGDDAASPYGAEATPTPRQPFFLVRFRWIAFALIALGFALAFNGHWRVGRDSATFRGIARNLVRSHQYVFRPRNASPRAARKIEKQEIVYPGMPLLLAGVDRVFGEGDLAPQLVMYGLAFLTLWLVYRLFRMTLGLWVAATVTIALGFNRVFLEHANELLSDLPFLFGLMLSLYGFERLRRARSGGQWASACAASVAGLGLAASMRPTFWMLAIAWVIACAWGLVRPENSPAAGRRRSPYAVALGLFAALALLAVLLDPRTRGGNLLAGGYERRVVEQLHNLPALFREAWEHCGKTLNEHIPTCFFAFAVKAESLLIARVVMTAYSILVIAAGVALFRRSRLWGLLVAVSVVALAILGDNPRYYLMVLPLLLAGWCLLCAPIARWLGPNRQKGARLAHALFGWAPRHPALPALAMLWGLSIVIVPNAIRSLDLMREQRGLDRRLRYRGFVDVYEEGKMAPLIRLGQVVKRTAPVGARILGPEPTILTYLSDHQVWDLDRMTGRWGRGWREGMAAMNFTHAVFPPRKAAALYGDRDPVICFLFDRHVLVPTRELGRTADGAKLCEYQITTLPGEHVHGARGPRRRQTTRRRGTRTHRTTAIITTQPAR